jgi:hypothetical protein
MDWSGILNDEARENTWIQSQLVSLFYAITLFIKYLQVPHLKFQIQAKLFTTNRRRTHQWYPELIMSFTLAIIDCFQSLSSGELCLTHFLLSTIKKIRNHVSSLQKQFCGSLQFNQRLNTLLLRHCSYWLISCILSKIQI